MGADRIDAEGNESSPHEGKRLFRLISASELLGEQPKRAFDRLAYVAFKSKRQIRILFRVDFPDQKAILLHAFHDAVQQLFQKCRQPVFGVAAVHFPARLPYPIAEILKKVVQQVAFVLIMGVKSDPAGGRAIADLFYAYLLERLFP